MQKKLIEEQSKERIVDKYPFIPISILKVKRHRKEQDLKKDRLITSGDKYYTNSSRAKFGNFDLEIGKFILKYFNKIKGGSVLDVFAGWGERGKITTDLGYDYFGFDISQNAINYAKEKYSITINKADSRQLPLDDKESIDFSFTCPPYWKLEKYESCDGQLTDINNYKSFLVELKKTIKETYRVLKQESLCCWVVGDFRIKGKLYDYSTDIINLFNSCGFEIFDKIIIDKSINYRISMFLEQAERLGYTVKLHEYILVFKKKVDGNL